MLYSGTLMECMHWLLIRSITSIRKIIISRLALLSRPSLEPRQLGQIAEWGSIQNLILLVRSLSPQMEFMHWWLIPRINSFAKLLSPQLLSQLWLVACL
jgi:hypothetical protein